ncbi:MAG: hypothetical protein OIN86_13115 [Candidatus Methanoperedens sp.]|nr:hypothetical protein [Candidatus Methanoperedens sp.]CAG0949064.1 hypothetical protein METP1_00078 [Methanosarcinales archaeon]
MKNKNGIYPKRKHLQAWFKEHFGCDPLKLGIPFITKKSHRPAGFYRLWKEEDVVAFKNKDKINPDALPDFFYTYDKGVKIPQKLRRAWQRSLSLH